jgi:7SK snRNA methylphosphate capping enzyme
VRASLLLSDACVPAQSYGASTVVGADLDATLISQAWKRRRLVWSLQQPPTSEPSVAKDEQERPSKRRKRTSSPSPPPALDPNYFPSAFQHELGPLPLPEEGDYQDREMFPLNVTFRAADWARDGIREDADGWDVIVWSVFLSSSSSSFSVNVYVSLSSFSVTKWIHLHGGDAGLKAFFRRIFDTLRPGGTLVLEPQEWSSYSKAWRMHPVSSVPQAISTLEGVSLRLRD